MAKKAIDSGTQWRKNKDIKKPIVSTGIKSANLGQMSGGQKFVLPIELGGRDVGVAVGER